MSAAPPPAAPGLGRRLASAVYESLLVAALVFIATFPWLAFVGDSSAGLRRHLLQLYVLAVVGAYFIWFWTRRGQTLAMKTWRIRLVADDGGRVELPRAALRFAFALIGAAALGAGFFWAFLDRDGQFLHDRLARTRLAPAA